MSSFVPLITEDHIVALKLEHACAVFERPNQENIASGALQYEQNDGSNSWAQLSYLLLAAQFPLCRCRWHISSSTHTQGLIC